MNLYESGLDKTAANYVPLTPLSFLARSARVYPDRLSVIHGPRRFTWRETYERCRRLASALQKLGIGKNDTVAVMGANSPETYECHFGVPMAGAVLNAINTRLDAKSIAYILAHGEAKVLLTDREFSPTMKEALSAHKNKPLVIDIVDPVAPDGDDLGERDYEQLLESGDGDFQWQAPAEEWDAISLNYTSGTTGNPKGVVYHHRGAYLNALSNIVDWNMGDHPVYLWTLPMFHCNGWCFPWTLAAKGGTNVCLRKVTGAAIYNAIAEHRVDHFCGAPIVLAMVADTGDEDRRSFDHSCKVMTAAAPPPPAVMERMIELGFSVTHVYGLTETYGPAVVCAWHHEWAGLPPERQADLRVRQGVPYSVQEGIEVADPDEGSLLPRNGDSLGEVYFRGNIVMKGYLKNQQATEEAFRGGWFHSGDLGVCHENGYIELKDRSKDIIISGGENISSIEVENVIYNHPAVQGVAVVAKPDDKWGETPCAFVELSQNAGGIGESDIIAYCRDNLAHYKCPRHVVFCEIPRTSTGKIQKFRLRDVARDL